MPSFAQLTVIVIAGLCGPLLSSSRRVLIPVVVGELLAGIALGRTGTGTIIASDPTIDFLGTIGFAVLMMVAGMHVPLRNRALLGSLRQGLVAVLVAAALAAAGGLAIAHGLDVGHPAIWTILLATGSAAIVLPALEEAGIPSDAALLALAWVTLADVATIVPVPLVLDPSKAARAGLGAVAVIVAAGVVLVLARGLQRRKPVETLRQESAEKVWALDLRVALVALFALCALAQWIGTSIMIAGFAAGLVVAFEGGPRRLSDQVTGIGAGFLVPLFFVVLGAGLDVRALVQTPKDLELAAALVVGITLVHVLAGRAIRAPLATSLIVAAQLGVPAAVVKLGLANHALRPGEAAAIILAALASLGICATGTALAHRSLPAAQGSGSAASGSPPDAPPPTGPPETASVTP
jgi:Kef-type K+ transport system membrane component KefB